MRRFRTTTAYLFLGSLFVAALHGQGTVKVTVDDAAALRELRGGDTVTFDSEGVGRTVAETFVISYESDNELSFVTITVPPAITGPAVFAISPAQSGVVRLNVREKHAFRVNFTPTGTGPFSGQLRFSYSFSGAANRETEIAFNLNGRVADYNVSYQLPGGNLIAVDRGGSVAFEDTSVDAVATATVVLTNRGSGPGTLNAVSISGSDAFELGGVGLLPATIQAERDFRFQVRFTPTAVQRFGSSVQVGFASGTHLFQCVGNGVAAVYSYDLTTSDGRTASVPENGTIALGAAPVGEEIAASLTVTNVGSVEGSINTVTITGDGYSLSDRPLLPVLLDVGESFTIGINLTPAEVGTAAGQLRIGDSTFDLTGEALGAELTYTLVDDDGPTAIEPRSTIVFPQTQIGGASELTLRISNSGNEAETISGIGVGAGAFSLDNLPALPSSLAADGTIAFTILFEPDRLGPQNAMLAVNAANFTLSGIGAAPPDLPAVSFTTSGGTVAPADFIPLGVSIAEAFPVDIEGVLRLSFDTAVFSNDPTIQFSTGGRNASFRIPKGETSAIFSGDVTLNPFLTGTVAGTITASATFTVGDSGVDITPDTDPEVVFTVNRAAPSLRSLALGSTGQGRFSILVTGYATSRTVTQLQIAFAETAGSNLATPNLTVDVLDSFLLYYSSSQSVGFGSVFTATINFTVEEGEFEDLSTVTITASNEVGQSNPVSLTLN